MNFPRVPWPWLNVSWSIFLVVTAIVLLSLAGFSWSIGFFLGLSVAVLAVWRFPFASLNLAFCSLMLSGIVVPISTGTIQIGERAFGTQIEVSLGELITVVVMLGWALRILWARGASARTSARPWLPLGLGFAGIVLAHALSAFSPALPDPLLVLKYTLRPVLFVYLAAVALPANFIRSWRRMDEACLALVGVGIWFALDGLRSLLMFEGDALGLYRAHPLPIFGINPLGGNHHALAELMVLVAPLALAWRARANDERFRFAALVVALLFWGVALLTFARAAWLVVAAQVLVLSATVWRQWVRAHARELRWAFICLSPLFVYMAWLSLGPLVAQSTSARTLLIDVAWSFFRDSPWIGVGAGTFPDRLSHIWAFVVEFGNAQDAHGMWQKVAAETGLIGLSVLLVTLGGLVSLFHKEWRRLDSGQEKAWLTYLAASVLGVFLYQWFSTSLWSPRVWIAVGLACAGMRLLRTHAVRRDPDFLKS